MSHSDTTRIVAFRDEHAAAFAALNREWLDAAGIYEPADGEHLYAPRDNILDRGGEIHIAERDRQVVGTVALVPAPGNTMELAKLAVAQDARGSGLGRRLTQLAIERARRRGVAQLFLLSNSALAVAVRLYESLGFEHRERPPDAKYETADVYMVMEFGNN